MHEVLVNRLGGLSLPRKSVVRLTDRPEMTVEFNVDVKQQYNNNNKYFMHILSPVTDNCPSSTSGRRNKSMLPDRVSKPGPLTYESGALPIALRGPAIQG